MASATIARLSMRLSIIFTSFTQQQQKIKHLALQARCTVASGYISWTALPTRLKCQQVVGKKKQKGKSRDKVDSYLNFLRQNDTNYANYL